MSYREHRGLILWKDQKKKRDIRGVDAASRRASVVFRGNSHVEQTSAERCDGKGERARLGQVKGRKEPHGAA